MDESGRKNKLEELLARVRERGSGLHRAVGPADAVAELDARLSSVPHAPTSLGRASNPASRRSSPSFALDLASVGPGPLIEDDELEQIASRRSLERYVEANLGDDEPSVPFTEEGEGWEPEPLELERSDGAAPVVEFPSEPAPPHGDADEAFDVEAGRAGDADSLADAASHADAAPKLRRRESFSELPPLPLSPFPSDPPPRSAEPTQSSEPALDSFGDLDTNGPQALPLDVPWETLAKQLRGRRRSGEFRVDESAASTGTGAEAQPLGDEAEAAAAPRAPAQPLDGEAGPTELERADRPPPERPSSAEPAAGNAPSAGDLTTPTPRSGDEAGVAEPPAGRPSSSEPPASERPASDPPASVSPAARPLSSEPPDAIAGEPSFLRSARRSRRARKERSSAWLPIAGLALLGLLALWWNRSDGARRSASRASTSAAPTTSPTAGVLGEPSKPRGSAVSAVSTVSDTSAAPLAAAATAAHVVAPQTISTPSSAEPTDTPPKEPLAEAEGWLRVRGRRFSVYLNGGLAGATGQWIRTSCGVRHLRLAHVDPPPRGRSFPWWVDEGGPVVVPCGASTTVEVDPGGRR